MLYRSLKITRHLTLCAVGMRSAKLEQKHVFFFNDVYFFLSDVVTCLSLDSDGRHLITGSRDTTCRIWAVTHLGGWASDVGRTPLQTLYGYNREITCVAISWEMDLVVSGAEVSVFSSALFWCFMWFVLFLVTNMLIFFFIFKF